MRIDSNLPSNISNTVASANLSLDAAQKKPVLSSNALASKVKLGDSLEVSGKIADSLSVESNVKAEAAAIKDSLKSMPATRADKIAQLKAQIASGEYNVSGRDIAEKIVSTAFSPSSF